MLTDRQGDCCVLTSSGWCRSSPARGCLVWVPSLSLWFLALADIAPGDDSVWAGFLWLCCGLRQLEASTRAHCRTGRPALQTRQRSSLSRPGWPGQPWLS